VGLFTGFWKLVVVAVVALILYGRAGLPRPALLRLLRPWPNTPRARANKTPASWLSDRWFVFLLVVASTAVAAWIVTRMALIETSSLSH
jgi:hypothetical protein